MSRALIVGASRGIGLEIVRQYIGAGWQVFGTHRAEADRQLLRSAGAHTLRLDVNVPEDLAGLAWQLDDEPLELVVLNAGLYGPRDSHIGQTPDEGAFNKVMQTNVLGAMRLVPILAPLLAPQRGTLAFLSSRMGSLAETNAGYGALYRISKAAVNMVTRLTHAEYGPQGVRVLALHPGWVRTDMGGPNAELGVGDSVSGLRKVIADAHACPGGGFYDYRGQVIAW
ncbi:MAG: SDR family oxidoreductase [Burkholderiaceae bacterium]